MKFFATLEEQCVQRITKLFKYYTFTNLQDLYEIHNYLETATPFMETIAERCLYHYNGNATLLFIPFLLLKGKLLVRDENINEVMLWIENLDNSSHYEQVRKLTSLKFHASIPENYFKLLPLLSKMPNITKLQLTSWTNDEVLAALGMYCKNLEVLDSINDGQATVTDVGLGYLSHLSSLKMILFCRVADEWDYEDKYKFTGKGIALLMLYLKNLERIVCPEYLLRDALHYIYQMNFIKCLESNNYLSIRTLFLAYPDVPANTITMIPLLCPLLENLSIYVPNIFDSSYQTSLKKLINLKKLKLEFGSVCNFDINTVDTIVQVDYLIIDAQFLHEYDLHVMDKLFPNMNTLCIFMHSCGFVPENSSRTNTPIFKNLHTLQLEQRISGVLFEVVNLKAQSLRILYLHVASVYEIRKSICNVVAKKGWKNLQIILLPMLETFDSAFLVENLLVLKNLKYFSAYFTCKSQEDLFYEEIKKCKSDLQYCNWRKFKRPSEFFTTI
ncbi:UNVERIFIED_CONTAM: hypothetical protein RMT77_005183 [Armadillidium vulgare]